MAANTDTTTLTEIAGLLRELIDVLANQPPAVISVQPTEANVETVVMRETAKRIEIDRDNQGRMVALRVLPL